MATRKTGAEECCAKCESDIAGLRKEIAALKKQLSRAGSGGKDLRVDKLIEILRLRDGSGKKSTLRKADMATSDEILKSL